MVAEEDPFCKEPFGPEDVDGDPKPPPVAVKGCGI
jgi:hypothetical protein